MGGDWRRLGGSGLTSEKQLRHGRNALKFSTRVFEYRSFRINNNMSTWVLDYSPTLNERKFVVSLPREGCALVVRPRAFAIELDRFKFHWIVFNTEEITIIV